MEHCPNCGGSLKIIAVILKQPVIEKILTHVGLQALAPPRASARGQALQAVCRFRFTAVQAEIGWARGLSRPTDAVRRQGLSRR